MDQHHEWAEDDFDVPKGVGRLGLSEPVSGGKYIMYHGTTKTNAQAIQATGFRRSADGMLGCGVYLSRDLQKASRYPRDHPEYDRVVIKVMVDVGKVVAIRYQGHPLQKTWHDSGYDTAWVPPKCGMVRSGLEEDCVWDPSRIKIITTIKPRPIQSPRPVQSSSSLGAWGYSDYTMPWWCHQPVYSPMMSPLQQMALSSMFSSDSDISENQPDTDKKTAKSRGTTKKKEEQSDSGISVNQTVTGKKTATSRGATRKKEEQSDSGISVNQTVTGKKTAKSRGATKKKEEQSDRGNNTNQLYLWTESDNDLFDRVLQPSFSEPVTAKKATKSRGPTRKK